MLASCSGAAGGKTIVIIEPQSVVTSRSAPMTLSLRPMAPAQPKWILLQRSPHMRAAAAGECWVAGLRGLRRSPAALPALSDARPEAGGLPSSDHRRLSNHVQRLLRNRHLLVSRHHQHLRGQCACPC